MLIHLQFELSIEEGDNNGHMALTIYNYNNL
jgi:hypothetical protein